MLFRSQVLYLSLNSEEAPYVFVVNHFFHKGELYFHCAPEGHKLDLMRKDARVGFATAVDVCRDQTTTRYRSVFGYGTLQLVEDAQLKNAALMSLAKKFKAPCRFPVSAPKLGATLVVHLKVQSMTGKQSHADEGPRPVPHYPD